MATLDTLAIDGGEPVRRELLPYARQDIDDEDLASVIEVLTSPWLTTGPVVEEFEKEFAAAVGATHAVAVSSGTAALHAAVSALGIGPGDEVIVPTMTFVATANCVVYRGAVPVFADVDPGSLLIDTDRVKRLMTPRTRAIIAVDYAGQPCDYDDLRTHAASQGVHIVADACHALGARYAGRNVGTVADLSIFSFHPAKHITTGEGGMVTTDETALAERLRVFRNHGITTDHRQRAASGSWAYQMVDLGFNYRLTDLQCALGITQLRKSNVWLKRRQAIAESYIQAFKEIPGIEPLALHRNRDHAFHLFVIRLADERLASRRDEMFSAMRAEGIGVNVHYMPVHLQPYYMKTFGTGSGDCPVAEEEYRRILSLPMFSTMTDADVADVLKAVNKTTAAFLKR